MAVLRGVAALDRLLEASLVMWVATEAVVTGGAGCAPVSRVIGPSLSSTPLLCECAPDGDARC
jgi:hypothetical protein